MCKVLTDYGIVADHGSKVLKLQKILGNDKEKTLALVSYKDGMSIGYQSFTREDASKIKEYLEKYLDYKPVVKEKERDIVKTLTTLPSGDCNYQTALRNATEADLYCAIAKMKMDGGRHATRIKACENALKKINSKSETVAEKKVKPPKEEKKIVQFPTEKPKIIPLKTKGDRTYEECVEKLNKEAEMFKDSDSQYVIEGLKELAKVDADFRNNIMREDKTYGGFMEYMFECAKNGYCVKYGNVGWLDRDLGLGLAIDYYNADCDKMKEEEEAKNKAEAEARKKELDSKKKGTANNGKNVRGKKKRVAG